MLLQQVIQGLAIGSVYGLLALGYVLMWQAWGVMDFARGDGAMVGAFYLLIFSQFKGLNIVLAFILAVGASALTGFVIERIAYRPILGGRDINRLIATIGVGMFTRNLYRVMFGADPFPFPSVFGDNPIHLGKLVIVPQNLWITAIGFGLAYLLRLFLMKSWMGKAMRATAQDRDSGADGDQGKEQHDIYVRVGNRHRRNRWYAHSPSLLRHGGYGGSHGNKGLCICSPRWP